MIKISTAAVSSSLSTLLALCRAAFWAARFAASRRFLDSSLAWRALAAFFSRSALALGSGCLAVDHLSGVVTDGDGEGGGVVVVEDVVRLRPEPWKMQMREKKGGK